MAEIGSMKLIIEKLFDSFVLKFQELNLKIVALFLK